MGQTTLNVPSREAWDYLADGWELVGFRPRPAGWIGLGGGTATVSKPGSECVHTWSPELHALHGAIDEGFTGQLYDLPVHSPVRRRLHEAHSVFFAGYHDLNATLEPGANVTVEELRDRHAGAIRALADNEGGDTKARLRGWSEAVKAWVWVPPPGFECGAFVSP